MGFVKERLNKTDITAKRDSKETIEELQMKEKIKHLEQALVNLFANVLNSSFYLTSIYDWITILEIP